MSDHQQCAVRGLLAPGGVCGSVITGGKLCGSLESCEHQAPAVGGWIRNKETGEAVRIESLGAMVVYRNADIDGEIQAASLHKHFDLLPAKPADADDDF